MGNWVEAWIRGDVDWDGMKASFQAWAPVLAGAVFGAGWWCFIDALVVSKVVLHDSFPFTYWLPGVVATIALVLMNLVPRESLGSTQYYGDEDSDTQARCWLFISYLISFASVAGAGAVFISSIQHHAHVQMGVGCLLQAGFILASALLLWAFRTTDTSDYMIY